MTTRYVAQTGSRPRSSANSVGLTYLPGTESATKVMKPSRDATRDVTSDRYAQPVGEHRANARSRREAMWVDGPHRVQGRAW